MNVFIWLAIAAVSLAISYLLRPKEVPQVATSEPPGEAEVPSVGEGEEIPVFFGVVWTSNPTVVWWGDTEIQTRSYEEPIEGASSGGKK